MLFSKAASALQPQSRNRVVVDATKLQQACRKVRQACCSSVASALQPQSLDKPVAALLQLLHALLQL
jgi:hypothetical protein